MARLTHREYGLALKDLFPSLTVPTAELPSDNTTPGEFDRSTLAQGSSFELVGAYAQMARALSDLVAANLSKVLSCAPTTKTEEASCGHSFIESFGKRAYRRPLSPQEIERMRSTFSAALSESNFAGAIATVVQTFLMSPNFLYRIEFGNESKKDGDRVALTSHEMASRLSFMLWDAPPDNELTKLADEDGLSTASAVETVARKMMDSPKAHATVANFHRQWLRFELMDKLNKSKTKFPTFTDATVVSLRDATAKFVEHVFWDEGDLGALLTEPRAYVNANLAALYGVAVTGKDMELVSLDSKRRAGILTQAGLLAGGAHSTDDAPVLRGVMVLDRFLCAEPPPPPNEVNNSPPDLVAGQPPTTTRQRLEQSHMVSPTCRACHEHIDGIGFAFGHYDAIGQWRDTDNGQPVDAKGWLKDTDVDGEVDGAVELAAKLAKSDQVRSCVASHWLRFARGFAKSEMTACMVQPMAKAFKDANYDMRELVVAITKSDAFRFRDRVKP